MRIREYVRTDMPEMPEQVYGIEVELENFRSPPEPDRRFQWTYMDDGSLRNMGVEFLTPGAWNLETCLEQIRLLWEQIHLRGWQPSVRTGIHVHVNCLDYTTDQLGGILATYSLLEPVLFRLCGPEREEGIYCVPWYRAGNEALLAHDVIAGNIRRANNTCKYSALYLQPLMRFGTIEFRHAPTYRTAAHMIRWLMTIDALVAYGKEHTAREVMNDFNEHGADVWAEEVFGMMFPEIMDVCEKSIEEIIDDVDSVSSAEDLLDYEGESRWAAPALYVQGNGTRLYHQVASRGPMYSIQDDFDPGYPEDYDEDYDQEEDY